MKRLAYVSIVIATVFLLVNPSTAELEPGDRPSLEVTTVDGTDIDLTDWRDRVVLIDFWATWCPPCRVSFPFYRSLAEKYDDEHFRVLAVSVDEEKRAVSKFLEKHDVPFAVTVDSDHKLVSKFKPDSMPTCYLVGPDGRIRYVHEGFEESDESELSERIASLVEEAKRSDDSEERE